MLFNSLQFVGFLLVVLAVYYWVIPSLQERSRRLFLFLAKDPIYFEKLEVRDGNHPQTIDLLRKVVAKVPRAR